MITILVNNTTSELVNACATTRNERTYFVSRDKCVFQQSYTGADDARQSDVTKVTKLPRVLIYRHRLSVAVQHAENYLGRLVRECVPILCRCQDYSYDSMELTHSSSRSKGRTVQFRSSAGYNFTYVYNSNEL